MSFEYIEKLMSWFERQNPLGYARLVLDFFIKPKSFWRWYSSASLEARWQQFGVYSFCYIVIFTVCHGFDKFFEISQSALVELGGMGLFVLITELAVAIGNMRLEKKDIIKTFLLCYYSYILLSPIAYIAILVYVRIGSMLAFGILLMIQISMEVYMLFGTTILFARKKHTLCTITTMIVILMACDLIYPHINIDNGLDKLIPDLVVRERHDLGLSLKMPYVVPAAVVTLNEGKRFYLYASPVDSVATRMGFTDTEYLEILRQDIDTLISIRDRTDYPFNRALFTDLLHVKMAIQQVDLQQTYRFNPPLDTIRRRLPTGESVVVGYIRPFNSEIKENSALIFSRDMEAASIYHKVCYLYCLRYPYRPVLAVRHIIRYCKYRAE